MSGHDVFYDPPKNIGQAKIAAIVTVGELFVVKPEQPENGGMQVMNMHLVLDRPRAEFRSVAP